MVAFSIPTKKPAAVCIPEYRPGSAERAIRDARHALIVIGSGAWRNTTKTGYNAEDGLEFGNTPKNIHIDEVQTPEAKYLQYILNVHEAAQDCSYWPLNADAMWDSMQPDKETQFVSNGEYVPTKKQ